MLFFWLLMLLCSICHQVSNQADKFYLLVIILPTFQQPIQVGFLLNRWAKHRQNNKIIARRSNLSATFKRFGTSWGL